MLDASLEDITKFLACKRVALLGVSRKPQHFSRALLSEFLEKGYDIVPVNPYATEIAERKCFAHVSEITPPVEAALLLTGKSEVTNRALRECNEAGVRHIWIYRCTEDSEDHTSLLEDCQRRGAALSKASALSCIFPNQHSSTVPIGLFRKWRVVTRC